MHACSWPLRAAQVVDIVDQYTRLVSIVLLFGSVRGLSLLTVDCHIVSRHIIASVINEGR